MGGVDPSALAEIMNRLWARHLPEIEERVSVLERAAAADAEGRLTAELCDDAESAAHKLAGVLGTFGLNEGSVLARQAEALFAGGPTAVAPSGERIALASQLRAMVADRAK